MSHPRVVNKRTYRGAEAAVYVGRPSVWGNPFSLKRYGTGVFRRYLDYMGEHPELVARAREELGGRLLMCWCAPRLCHAEVLARLADGEALEAVREDVLAQVVEQRALFD